MLVAFYMLEIYVRKNNSKRKCDCKKDHIAGCGSDERVEQHAASDFTNLAPRQKVWNEIDADECGGEENA